MTLKECYSKLHGNYSDVRSRLVSDRLVEKFLLKFPSDPSMGDLTAAVAAGDREKAFRAVHTLKGVAANLGLSDLQYAASALTEQMRGLGSPANPSLLDAVKASYRNTMTAIETYRYEHEQNSDN